MSSNQVQYQQTRSNQTINSSNVNASSRKNKVKFSIWFKLFYILKLKFLNLILKKRAVWEVIEGYRDPNMKVAKPQNHEGVLLKRRNWPMKGWHKRYFILADGILTYGKNKTDVIKKISTLFYFFQMI